MCYLIEFSQWKALLPSHSMRQETGPEQQADGGTQGSRAQAFNTRLPCLRGACSVSLWVTNSASVCRGKAGGGLSPQPSLPLILTFLFSCWISASVTACLIWSYGGREAGTWLWLGQGLPLPSTTPGTPSSHLLELVHQLLGLHVHRGQGILVFRQLKHLDGHLTTRERGTQLLIFVGSIFSCLQRERGGCVPCPPQPP